MGGAFFLKKKPKPAGVAGRRPVGAPVSAAARPRPTRPPPPKAARTTEATPEASASTSTAATPKNDNVTEIAILSGDQSSGQRFNLMRLNSTRDVDPSALPKPIMMNRKQPGPKLLPTFVHDEDGKVIGRYVFDDEGKPVLDAEGKPTIEKRDEMDMSLVGTAPGQSNRRRGKRNTREVFHQDVEVIKLRREEANPWVLESKTQSENPEMPEYWVGRYEEPPSSMVPILLVNEGDGATFTMVPLGRTYRFEPKRPFEVMDADQAHKYFETQVKYKIHDRWGQRQEGSGSGGPARQEGYLEAKAQRMEDRIKMKKGEDARPAVVREKFEDDYVKEQRNIGRGLEGGADEELDFDLEEAFQDDEDSNTFYINNEEEEEKKLQEEKQKLEFRLANANVGDRPQIGDEDDDEDDDLFGKLTSEGKRLRKVMRRRGEDEDLYASSDSNSDSDSDEELAAEPEKKDTPGSAERPSRPISRSGSRGPDSASGSPSRHDRPLPAGVALLAKRGASRGASPHRSRAGSPLARGSSPNGRSGSPSLNGRAGSPMSGRGSSPAASGREGTPGADGRPKSKSAKRKATSQSPLADSPGSTPGSPVMSDTGSPAGDPERKKKKKNGRASGSATPAPYEGESFPGMITREQVLTWLRSQPTDIPMRSAINAFSGRITAAGDDKEKNQKLFLHWVKELTERGESSKVLKLKAEFVV